MKTDHNSKTASKSSEHKFTAPPFFLPYVSSDTATTKPDYVKWAQARLCNNKASSASHDDFAGL
jgi:hypothetical protein